MVEESASRGEASPPILLAMSHREPFVVRRARPEDLDRLVTFNAAMALETEGRTLDPQVLRRGILAVLESPGRGFYLVTESPEGADQAVIGQLMITYEWSDWRNAAFWWIQSVYVDPPWRRRGVYRRMHEEVLEQARARDDVCGVRLYVEAGNTTAQTVYKRVGLSHSSYWVFEEDFVLAKRPTRPQGE